MIISLDGTEWSMRDALGLTWQWYVNAALPVTENNVADAAELASRAPGWLPATVPGSVIDDLMAAGELPDVRVGRNSRSAEWVAERSWVYRRAVELPEIASGERAVLELEGVDPGGIVFWDGVEVGRVEGLYRRIRIDLTERLRGAPAGRHRLAVVVHRSPESEPQVGRTELVRVHSPRMNYGWDFSPRMRHQGIWQSARIVIGAVHLASVSARTELSPDLARGIVTLAAESPIPFLAKLRKNGVVVAENTGNPGEELRLEVDFPELWWPNGYGEQALYELEVTAGSGDAGGAEWSRRVGFRRIEFRRNEGAPPSALPYTAVVNGVAMPLLGWNWAPADTLYGTVTAERLRHLIGLAARSGARVLRVWGGGLIETEQFYDACDEAGLLVWQEFSQSSSGMQSAPAADAEFVDYLRREAEAIVPTRTHHPSLAIWGGGNELADETGPLSDDCSPALTALKGVVETRDPGRAWLATSPTGPEFANRLDRIREAPDDQHDVHGPWEHQGLVGHYELYNAGTSLAHTEFGVEGMTNLRSLYALVPEKQRWPADRSNAVYRHLGEWWNNAPLVQESFGGRLGTVEELQRASQLQQATGLQYAVESDRRRWPPCSMVVPWQLNESYPNAWCTSSVDYRGEAKPAYHAVARAYRQDRVTLQVDRAVWAGQVTAEARAWLWSERGVAAGSTVTLRARDLSGAVLEESTVAVDEVGRPRRVAALQLPVVGLPSTGAGAVFFWDAEWTDAGGTVIDRETMLASAGADWSGLLELPRAELEVSVSAADTRLDTGRASGGAVEGLATLGSVEDRTVSGGGDAQGVAAEEDAADAGRLVRIRHLAGPAVVGLRISDVRPADAPGFLAIEGDPRPLLPGEERVWAVGGARGPLRVESWNTESLEIE